MECIGQEDPVSYDEIDEENVFTIIENGRVYCYTKDTIMRLYQSQGTLRNPLTNVPLSSDMIEKVENFVNGKTIPIRMRTTIKMYAPYQTVGDVIKDYFEDENTNILTDNLNLYDYDFNTELGSIMNENGYTIKVTKGTVSDEDLERYKLYFNLPNYFVPLVSENSMVTAILESSHNWEPSEIVRIFKKILPTVVVSSDVAEQLSDVFHTNDITELDQMIVDAVSDYWNLDRRMFPTSRKGPVYTTNFGIHPRTGEKIPYPRSYEATPTILRYSPNLERRFPDVDSPPILRYDPNEQLSPGMPRYHPVQEAISTLNSEIENSPRRSPLAYQSPRRSPLLIDPLRFESVLQESLSGSESSILNDIRYIPTLRRSSISTINNLNRSLGDIPRIRPLQPPNGEIFRRSPPSPNLRRSPEL
ncbi:hypothetical protein D3C87_877670 [compost metagenome]